MHGPVSMRYLLPQRLQRAATSILASKGGGGVHHDKFPGVVRTFRGNRHDESSSPNNPVRRTTVRLARTNCKRNESFNYALGTFDCGLRIAERNKTSVAPYVF